MTKKKLLTYIALTLVCLTLGILLCIPDLARDILNIVMALGLAIYLIFFLVKRVLNKSTTLKLAVYVVEITLVALMVLGLTLAQFDVFVITDEIVQLLGLVLWIRATATLIITMFGTYPNKEKVALIAAIIILFTMGTWLFASPFISNQTLRVVFIVAFFLVAAFGILVIINYFVKKPAKPAK